MSTEDRRLYLIRHARPDYDSSDRTDTPRGEQYDPPLGEVGIEQARLLADRIGIEVIERDDLCEWFGGEWEEKDFEEIFAEHPEAIELFRNQNPAWHLAPGSEAGEAFQDRCVTAVENIIATHPAGDVIVVAHGGVINAYFAHILKIADQDMFFLPENTSLNTVVIRGDERLAWFLSDASHLTDPGWFAPRLAADGDAVEAGA